MNFWDYNVWQFIIQMSIILVSILLGNSIRRKVKFIRSSLIPTSVLAGIIIFILKFIPLVSKFIDTNFMETLTYHALGLGFVALSLKSGVKSKDTNKLVVMDTGLITVNTYLVQAIIGLILSISMVYTIFPDFFYAAGLILPMGFGQGTGQALNFGKIYEGFGFTNGSSFGLSIAAIGFFVACIVGVFYMNFLKKTGKLKVQEERKEIANDLNSDIYAPDEAPLTESVDKLTMQLGFIFGVYIFTYLFIFGLSFVAENYLGNFGVNTLKPLFWGFNFLFGSIFAILAKKLVHGLRVAKIMNHAYINDYMMNRLSGFFFDIMIVAGIAAINWKELKGYLWPLLIICIFGTIGTFAYVSYACKRRYKEYRYEAFFAMFGMLTGTASTGMILLREIDPNYETPAADNLVLQQLPAILFGAPLLLLMTFAGQNVINTLFALGVFILMFVIYNIILLRRHIFKKRKKKA
jgi:ESS family glutamate:Na+ symporter